MRRSKQATFKIDIRIYELCEFTNDYESVAIPGLPQAHIVDHLTE